MYARVWGASIMGLEGYKVVVEVDLSVGLPAFEIVGLPNASVREAKERVRSAIKNSGYTFPLKRIIVNLAPADIKKESAGLDLAICIGILAATKQVPRELLEKALFIGELSLEGHIRSVKGVLAMVLERQKEGLEYLFVSDKNVEEAALSTMKFIHGVATLKDVVTILQRYKKNESVKTFSKPVEEIINGYKNSNSVETDIGDVQGQIAAKRALEIAAAGGHNILMVGPPGSGKTMLAERIVSILPPLTMEEAIEVTKIYSIAGRLNEDAIKWERPFRHPHHTITSQSMVGGGGSPKPGEVTLSHRGVLFLDEFPEFSRSVIDVLRQPVEDGLVNISRIHGSYSFPAEMTLILALNPCPCGYLHDPDHTCVCSDGDIYRYKRKLSGPLLDRIDLFVTLQRPTYDELNVPKKSKQSQTIQKRVLKARSIQKERFIEGLCLVNGRMNHGMVREFCCLDKKGEQLLKDIFTAYKLSARNYDRILKVARTIADLEEDEYIRDYHIAEAASFRNTLHIL